MSKKDNNPIFVVEENKFIGVTSPSHLEPHHQWQSITRKNDKLAIVGFAETRNLTPWEDPTFDIWGVNEEYNYPWMKRFDLWFQMHPRWDFTRPNNMNHYNHFSWLRNLSTTCIKCQGAGTLKQGDKEVPCDECKDGIYHPDPRRAGVPIIMQEQYDDIPDSIRFPLEEATAILPLNGYPYFTSSVSFMLALAYLMGYTRIELYGFEMGTQTEYHYQRANFEYWVGLLQAKGVEIYIPKASPLLKGELYGYKNMKTGFRQNLEMRKQFLEIQERTQADRYHAFTGRVEQTQVLVQSGHPELVQQLNELMPEYAKIIGTHNVIKGALAEVKNLIELYDHYFVSGVEDGGATIPSTEEFLSYTNLAYTQN